MTISPNKWELDVQGYLNVCNITSATPRQQIRDFSKGVNDLGLWNSMVCWPLRSSQNYGSGTTAFSLGGRGTFNGTLVNGPSWGADGIDMLDENKRIETQLGPLAQPLSVFSVQQIDVTPATTSIVYDNDVNTGGNRTHIYHNSGSTDLQVFAGSGAIGGSFVDDVMFAYQVSFNGASSTYSKDGAAATTINSGTGAATQFRIGSPSAGQRGSLMAFCAVINGASVPAFYTLYKTTLGTGLSLP
jgi:hypothetical protein